MHANRAALRMALVGGIGVITCALASWALRAPLLFPSLGPTALMTAHDPTQPGTRPSTVAIAHTIGLLAGFAMLSLFGLRDTPSMIADGASPPRMAATTLAVMVTGLLMVLLKRVHWPAAATTLVVTLGVLRSPVDIANGVIAVLVLVTALWLVGKAIPFERTPKGPVPAFPAPPAPWDWTPPPGSPETPPSWTWMPVPGAAPPPAVHPPRFSILDPAVDPAE